jgi:transcription elongation factor GreA
MSEATNGRILMTSEGYQKLKEELAQLEAERPKLAQQIARARSYGDLSENAEYHAAKERQAFLEARIRELQHKLVQAQVLDPAENSNTHVSFGSLVTLQDSEKGTSFMYQIVGPEEADPLAGRISANSPVGRALLGRSLGEAVQVQTPLGACRYTIIKIG